MKLLNIRSVFSKARKLKLEYYNTEMSQSLFDDASSKPAYSFHSSFASGMQIDPGLALPLIVQTKLSNYHYEVIEILVKDIVYNIVEAKKSYLEHVTIIKHLVSVCL